MDGNSKIREKSGRHTIVRPRWANDGCRLNKWFIQTWDSHWKRNTIREKISQQKPASWLDGSLIDASQWYRIILSRKKQVENLQRCTWTCLLHKTFVWLFLLVLETSHDYSGDLWIKFINGNRIGKDDKAFPELACGHSWMGQEPFAIHRVTYKGGQKQFSLVDWLG